MHAATIVVGDQLGLYKALAEGPHDGRGAGRRTETDARYLREWLSAQAASGYVQYDPPQQRFRLTEEQAFALAQEGSPAFIPGAFQIARGAVQGDPEDDAGLPHRRWASAGTSTTPSLFHGTERFFRPGYAANLVSQWLPALDGVGAELQAGAHVADVGCGHGASTILMAQAYPKSTLRRLRLPRAVDRACARGGARSAGVADRVRFEVGHGQGLSRHRLRPGDVLRLPARHGRPGRRRGARARSLEARRHLDDRRAVRQRPAGGQPQPGRPRLLLGLDLHLHAGLALAGGRDCAWARRPARRGCATSWQQGGFSGSGAPTETPFNLIFEARP